MTSAAKPSVSIRPARAEDSAAIADVLRRSITELCVFDHENNPDWLRPWLANKTPEQVAGWIANLDNHMFVALRDGQIVAAGSINSQGYIGLNYVAPEARFCGISRMMLAHLEALARDLGLSRVFLTSTGTARRFYLQAGYRLRRGEDAGAIRRRCRWRNPGEPAGSGGRGTVALRIATDGRWMTVARPPAKSVCGSRSART